MSIQNDKLMNLADGKVLYDDLRRRVDGKMDEPASEGSNGQVLTTDGNGGRSWTTPSGGGGVSDVQVNGTSVVSQGVANIPIASTSGLGVAKIQESYGIGIDGGKLYVIRATENDIKAGSGNFKPITPANQGRAVFFGLANVAGDTTQANQSGNNPGTYTETAKSKISNMLNAPETVSGSTPSITAKAGVRYICGEVSTLSITAPESGCVDIVFESGSTPTVLTVTSAKTGVSAIKWAGSFDPTSLDADTTYEINILDGEFGVVGEWT